MNIRGTNERDLQAASLLHRSCWMKQVSAFPASGGLLWRRVRDLCEQGKCLLGIFLLLIAWECCTCTILPNSDSSPRSSPPFSIVSPSRPSGWGYRDTLASPRTLWTVDCIVSLARAALNEDHKQFVILLQYMYSVNLFMMRLQTDWINLIFIQHYMLWNLYKQIPGFEPGRAIAPIPHCNWNCPFKKRPRGQFVPFKI